MAERGETHAFAGRSNELRSIETRIHGKHSVCFKLRTWGPIAGSLTIATQILKQGPGTAAPRSLCHSRGVSMKIVITSFGTRGDFEPFIALAEELAGSGHEPVFAIPPSALEYFQSLQFKYSTVGDGMPDIREAVNLAWTEAADAYTSTSGALGILTPLHEYLPGILNELIDKSADAAVLVSSATQPLARIVHDLTGVPFVSVQFSHFGGNGGPALNAIGEAFVNGFRRELGLGAIKHPLTIGANSPQLALYAMSSHLIGRPTEWPKHYHITGFFFRSETAIPPPHVTNFLLSGPPPVAVSFGSMAHKSDDALISIMAEAIRRCGVRAIIQGVPPAKFDGTECPDILWAEYLPHSYVFERTACVVCHGGAGTSAQAFKAGVPIVFVPHGEIYDQRYWAQIATEMGSSPEAIPYRELSVERMTAALRSCLNDGRLANHAKQFAEKVRRENGVRKARQLIEALVHDVGLDRHDIA